MFFVRWRLEFDGTIHLFLVKCISNEITHKLYYINSLVPTIEVLGDQNDEICTIYFRLVKTEHWTALDVSLHLSGNVLELSDEVSRKCSLNRLQFSRSVFVWGPRPLKMLSTTTRIYYN